MTKFFKLKDGRRLAFEEYGDSDGKPVFYFHGWPASRFSGAVLDKPAKKLGLRIIAPDRSGYGLSDPKFDRRMLDWPKDIVELADHLKIRKFRVMGSSGGAPYVYACAYAIPKRIILAGVIAGLGPILLGKLRLAGWAANNIFTLWHFVVWAEYYMTVKYLHPKVFDLGFRSTWMSPSDKSVMKQYKDTSRKTILEAFRQGVRDVAYEWKIYANPWGFKLDEIKVPFTIWHGLNDRSVPHITAETSKEMLRNAKLITLKTSGHYLLYERGEEILRQFIK